MARISGKTWYRLLVITGGLLAIVAALLGIFPALMAFLGLVYGILIPAYYLHAYYRRSFAPLSPGWTFIPVISVFIPIWLAFSVVWLILFGNLITQGIAGIETILIILCTVAIIVRDRYPKLIVDARTLHAPSWRGALIGASIALAFSLVVLGFSGLPSAQVNSTGPLTEFYLLPDSLAQPDLQKPSESIGIVRLPIRIVNREGESGEYRVVATIAGNRAVADIGPIHLENNGAWQGEIQFPMTTPDHQEIQVYLERTGSVWPYRTLRTWIGSDQ